MTRPKRKRAECVKVGTHRALASKLRALAARLNAQADALQRLDGDARDIPTRAARRQGKPR